MTSGKAAFEQQQQGSVEDATLPSDSSFRMLRERHGVVHKHGLSLEWAGICFNIGKKDPPILHNVDGNVRPKRLLAVMGESGSGKTTLMNVLSGRQRTRGVTSKSTGHKICFSGNITMSGKSSSLYDRRRSIAYVFQDIAFVPTETPRECLEFSAYLRLPTTWAASDRTSYVSEMLTCLHLDQCADVPVGSMLEKGLSGGEQKRVSIGVDMICNPEMLFLDEPLSGLDSCNAFTVVRTLKLLVTAGVPVMFSIHQPSSHIFNMIDDILVLHRGEVCYHGPTSSFTRHLEDMGHRCPDNHNPADFVMFLFVRMPSNALRAFKDAWLGSTVAAESRRGRLKLATGGGEAASSDDDESEEVSDKSSSDADSQESWSVSQHTEHSRGFGGQLSALVRRDFRMMTRSTAQIITTNVAVLIVSLIYGWFFFGAGRNEDDPAMKQNCQEASHLYDGCLTMFVLHIGIIGLISINMMLVSTGIAMDIVHALRPVLLRERAGNFYSITAFFFSKCIVEVWTTGLATLATLLGTYWTISFKANFFVLFAEILLLATASASLMYVLSAASKSAEQAQSLVMLPQVLQFAFSGLLIPPTMVPVSLQWIKWCCPLFYGMGMLSVTEFQYVFDAWGNCVEQNATETVQCAPWKIRNNLFTKYGSAPDNRWFCILMLIMLTLGFRTLSVFVLSSKTKFAV